MFMIFCIDIEWNLCNNFVGYFAQYHLKSELEQDEEIEPSGSHSKRALRSCKPTVYLVMRKNITQLDTKFE